MKSIVQLFLQIFPRSFLQRISPFALRFLALFYAGNRVTCPISEKSFRKFLPYGRINPRINALCPECLALERHRLMWLYLKNKTNFFTDKLKVLHIAPEYCFMNKFRRMENIEYITGDLESPLANLKFDIHDIPLPENDFDVIFCNHVLEHVEDDRQAMREMFRIMKPGGWGIFLIPLFFPLPEETIEDPTIKDPKERERLFGQSDHVRKYGMDYVNRLEEAGFNVSAEKYAQELTEAEVEKYALPKEEIIFFCQKPNV